MLIPVLFGGFFRVVNGGVCVSTACASQRARTQTQAAAVITAPHWCGVLWKQRSCSSFSLSITASNVNLLIALSAFSWGLLKPQISLLSCWADRWFQLRASSASCPCQETCCGITITNGNHCPEGVYEWEGAMMKQVIQKGQAYIKAA